MSEPTILQWTMEIIVRNLAHPELKKLYVSVKCPSDLLPIFDRFKEFLEFQAPGKAKGGPFQLLKAHSYQGPAPDDAVMLDEIADLAQARAESIAAKAQAKDKPRLQGILQGGTVTVSPGQPNFPQPDFEAAEADAITRRKMPPRPKTKKR